MKVYITKYALTQGIYEAEAERCTDISPTMIELRNPGYVTETFHGNDWHETKEEAVARAEEMRLARVKSLEKSIAKLRKLVFSC
jgi:hypothetical protein